MYEDIESHVHTLMNNGSSSHNRISTENSAYFNDNDIISLKLF